jgi:hypothetical protein
MWQQLRQQQQEDDDDEKSIRENSLKGVIGIIDAFV